MKTRAPYRKVATVLLLIVFLYTILGLAFHVAWTRAQATCREARAARGEFVEPEVFGGALGLFFDVTWWPVYAWANVYHFGTPLATPCDH
ncbi:MAG: hypothetical protein ACUVXH_09430 [Anaerolineae bacterium]